MTDEIEKNIKFINDDDISEDTYLWKYFDLHKFISLIISKSFHLTRLDKFEDRREGISPIHLLFKTHKKELDSHPMFDKMRTYLTVDNLGGEMNKIEDELKKIQRFNFANCWVIGRKDIESVAMWNLYSDSKSLAIRIKYSDFKSNILNNGYLTNGYPKELICSPVKYLNFQDKKNISEFTNNLWDSVFLKDSSFQYENEFRIIARENEREIPEKNYESNISRSHIEKLYNSSNNYPGVKLELINFEDYQFEVVHHPKSSDWIKENINEVIKRFDIRFNIFDSNLELK